MTASGPHRVTEQSYLWTDRPVAWITGAGRGIGEATALHLASLGARIAVTSRTAKDVASVVARIQESHGNEAALAVVADVSSESDVLEASQKIHQQLGQVSILINNAGSIRVRPIAELTLHDWNQTLSVNLTGAFLCAREIFRRVGSYRADSSGTKSTIINISSLAGIQKALKFQGFAAYSSAKMGVIGLTEVLAVEGQSLGIRVCAVAPGATDTQMLRDALPHLKPGATPMDVARIIANLCDSGPARAASGTVIEIHSNVEVNA